MTRIGAILCYKSSPGVHLAVVCALSDTDFVTFAIANAGGKLLGIGARIYEALH